MFEEKAQEPWAMFSRAGKDMFNNELFSDAKVTAGDKTWPIHKSIVCSRCEYFEKAFTGPFMEATTNHLTIKDQDSKLVEVVLRYFYTGRLEEADIVDIKDAVDIFVAADYFGIRHLRGLAILALEFIFDELQGRPDLDDEDVNIPVLRDEDIRQIFHAVYVAYASGLNHEALREPIEKLLVSEQFLFTKDDRFMREVENIPKFSVALIRLMNSPSNKSQMKICSSTLPKKCTICGLKGSEFAETMLIAYPKYDPTIRRALAGTCAKCVKKRESAQKHV